MTSVARFTTRYVPSEDRIHVAMEMAGGEVVALALTRRLLNRLARELLNRLPSLSRETSAATPGSPAGDLVQAFSQQAALSTITPQKPVTLEADGAGDPSPVLVTVIDIQTRGDSVLVIFKTDAERLAVLPLTEQGLRRWLGILHSQYKAGEWAEAFWPAWIAGQGADAGRQDARIN